MTSTNPAPTTAPRLILASASPRRSEILTEAGVPFEVIVSRVDEQTRPDESPEALVERLAREKCLEVAARVEGLPARPVLGADTIVVADAIVVQHATVAAGRVTNPGEARVLGKPRDPDHAVELLSLLVGTTHRVMTAIAVDWTDERGCLSQVVTSRVTMRPADREELIEYVAVGESLDKAGGYALQGEGRRFVTGVDGSRTNVIGLPREETLALLRQAGVPEATLRA